MPRHSVTTFGAGVLLAVLLSMTDATAQSAATSDSADLGDAPVVVNGWRHIGGPNGLHIYVCEDAGCVPGSNVSVGLYPFNPAAPAVLPGRLTYQRKTVGKILQQRLAPCTMMKLSLFLSEGPVRLHCVATVPDGAESYGVDGLIYGLSLLAALISESNDEAASDANYLQFEAALTAIAKSDFRLKP